MESQIRDLRRASVFNRIEEADEEQENEENKSVTSSKKSRASGKRNSKAISRRPSIAPKANKKTVVPAGYLSRRHSELLGINGEKDISAKKVQNWYKEIEEEATPDKITTNKASWFYLGWAPVSTPTWLRSNRNQPDLSDSGNLLLLNSDISCKNFACFLEIKFQQACILKGKSDVYLVSSKGDFFNFSKVSRRHPLRRLSSLLHTQNEQFVVLSQEREAIVLNFPRHQVENYPKVLEALRRIDRISTVRDLSNFIEAEKAASVEKENKSLSAVRKGSIQVLTMASGASVKTRSTLQNRRHSVRPVISASAS
ncbi:unnamed protein product [Oikopleura dioica]|uniref:Uncharacterized protein n=1 Tax=Oikopleura dioica TaxID=34765 RepID=E4X0B3_OIKDI|nr:unnamed protein product [Oikopleura dioica]